VVFCSVPTNWISADLSCRFLICRSEVRILSGSPLTAWIPLEYLACTKGAALAPFAVAVGLQLPPCPKGCQAPLAVPLGLLVAPAGVPAARGCKVLRSPAPDPGPGRQRRSPHS
jgi:hypothetical protein